MKRKNKFFKYKTLLNILVFLAIYAFLLTYFKPSLLLTDTHISGGDTGSFNYMLEYLKNYLLPHDKIVGWSPGWYAGIPMFQFYFPTPFLLAALLGYLIPLNVAFKLTTVLGTFLLPLAIFFAARLMKFKFPAPIIAATLTLLFLFNEGNSMWGGNIPSTLAGEFSYSLSMALTALFLGSIYKGVKEKKLLLFNSVLLALIGLTHVYTLLFAGLTSLFFILKKDKKDSINNFKYLLKTYAIAFLLVGFWFVPAMTKLQYRTPLDYVWNIRSVGEVLPPIILPSLILSFFGAYFGLRQKDDRICYILFILAVSLLLYWVAKFIKLVDIRFVPFSQLFLVLLASYALQTLVGRMKFSWVVPLIVFILVVGWVKHNVTYIPYWIEWNYKGFEDKEAWPQFNAINNYLASLPEGRVVHEFSRTHDKFGTTRAFESLPLFAKKPVLEGLLIESAVNAPFVFWIQSEISETPTCPIPGMRCSQFTLENATEHLKLFNADYLIATSEKLKNAIANNSQYNLLEKFGEIEIYRINNTGNYVELPKYEPVLVKTKNWKEVSLEWFKNIEILDVPLVFSQQDESMFNTVIDDNNLTKIEKIPIDTNCSVKETVKNDEIIIKTSCIGRPLWIKVSYFPNWKVEGADKIYLASPAFMLIFPNQENVRIYYGKDISDIVGEVFSYIGLAIVVMYVISNKFSRFLNSL